MENEKENEKEKEQESKEAQGQALYDRYFKLNDLQLLKLSLDYLGKEAYELVEPPWINELNSELNLFLNRRTDVFRMAYFKARERWKPVHVEVQATWRPVMVVRMWIYFGLIWFIVKKRPIQILFYIGRKKIKLKRRYFAFGFRFHVVQLCTLDYQALLMHPDPFAVCLAPFANTPDPKATFIESLKRLQKIDDLDEREKHLSALLGLSNLEKSININDMDIANILAQDPEAYTRWEIFIQRQIDNSEKVKNLQAQAEAEKARAEKAELEKAQAELEKAQAEKAQAQAKAELEKAQAEKAQAQAQAEKQLQVFRMFANNEPMDKIVLYTGLSIDEIKTILGK